MPAFYAKLGFNNANGGMSFYVDSLSPSARLHPLQQHPHFAAALAGINCPVTEAELPDNGTVQVMERRIWPTQRNLRVVSRGPVWEVPPDDATQLLAITALREARVNIINGECTPAHVMRAAGYRQIMTPASIAVIDLRSTGPFRRAAMTAKWRNALRKAEHAGLFINVRGYDPVQDHWILEADARQQRRKGYTALPGHLTQAYALMNKGQVTVVNATDGNAIIAAMIFLRHGATATYHIGWTSDAGRLCNAHNLCLATAMDVLSSQGFETLDLGTVDTEHAPGIARFKLGTGARVKRLSGTWLHLPIFRKMPLAGGAPE